MDAFTEQGTQYEILWKACCKSASRRSVHEFRITLRRLIATLDLIAALIRQKQFRKLHKFLKNLLHWLRDLRDIHVQEKSLKAHYSDLRLKEFMIFLGQRKKQEKNRVKRKLKRVSLKKWTDQLLQVKEELTKLSAARRNSEQDSMRLKRIIAREKQKFKTCAHQATPLDIKTFHRARIQFKKFRYLLEVLDPIFPLSKKRRQNLKAIQTLLGEIQDTVILTQSLLSFISKHRISPTHSNLLTLLRLQGEIQGARMRQFQKEEPSWG